MFILRLTLFLFGETSPNKNKVGRRDMEQWDELYLPKKRLYWL